MRFVYGPVISRRIGVSLGISLTPYKICNFDCIYCQLGRTREKTNVRKEYIASGEIIDEVRAWISANKQEEAKLNYLTISGLGEPTLNTGIGRIISEIKKISGVPLAVITNASYLNDKEVRSCLLSADLIVPSLDAASQEVFEKIDRPSAEVKLNDIIEGLVDLRKEYSGKIWLEVMLVSGVNDDIRHIKKLKETIDRIEPDKIQLNSPVRTTSEENVLPVERAKLEKIKEILGDRCEIV
ncbi:MAG: radical SAM protein [Candidatus Omnitrophica bacterium]|nr:radical SAM protein [Candidatus Omnitrophota bacterium]MBU1870049.1 radical SAM protein [Candidatus Omnitrophota bacterium]